MVQFLERLGEGGDIRYQSLVSFAYSLFLGKLVSCFLEPLSHTAGNREVTLIPYKEGAQAQKRFYICTFFVNNYMDKVKKNFPNYVQIGLTSVQTLQQEIKQEANMQKN